MIELLQGDCLELMTDIPDQSIDMILCDLPYGTTQCEWDKLIPFVPLWEQYERVIKTNGAIVLFSAQPFTTDLINSNRKLFRYEIVWKKTVGTNFLNANRMPLKAHENILVFYKKLPTYNPQKTRKINQNYGKTRRKAADRMRQYGHVNAQDYTDTGERYPVDVIEFSNWNGIVYGETSKATKHPTQKPVPLLEWLIKTYTNEDDMVLDNCMGSGSTGVACLNTNRNFIGIEIEKKYYLIAKERISNAQKEPRQITLFDGENGE